MGIRYISSYIKSKSKHDIEFLDALKLGFNKVKPYSSGFIVGLGASEIVDRISPDSDFVGVSAPFSQLAPIAHEIISRCKKRYPNMTVVMGGAYPSAQPKYALQSDADMIVVGEGEKALLSIIEGGGPKDVAGVYTRADKDRGKYPPSEMINELDEIPFPDYSLPNIEEYFAISQRNIKNERTASIITSRGCPFVCEFCSIHPIYGRRWRYRSAENTLGEIEYLHKTFGVNRLEIEDDNFTLKKQRTIDILEGIIKLNESGADISWRTPNGVMIQTLDEDLIKIIKRSNCKQITLALEHGDKEMLKVMNKQLDLDHARKTIRLLVKHGIPEIVIFVIVGYPEETNERFANSLQYLKEIKNIGGNIHICMNIIQPYPGTQLFDRAVKYGYVSDDSLDNFLDKGHMMNTQKTVYITTADFDESEVLERIDKMSQLFYGSRLGNMARSIKPLRDLVRMVKKKCNSIQNSMVSKN